jgi:hypothetical protein
MRGELPGWEEIPAGGKTKIECYLRFGVSEYLPETAEELQAQQVPKPGPDSGPTTPKNRQYL